jgi:hypothetical protein
MLKQNVPVIYCPVLKVETQHILFTNRKVKKGGRKKPEDIFQWRFLKIYINLKHRHPANLQLFLTFVVKRNKGFGNGGGELGRQRELCAVPIEGGPKLFQLLQDGSPLLWPPFPYSLHKGGASQLPPIQPLAGRQVLLYHHLLHNIMSTERGRTVTNYKR